jgi:GGDEF domain-containing protein
VLDGADRGSVREEFQRLLDTLHQENLKVSIGVAFYPEDGTDEATLFNAADAALYATKHGGKDSFGFSI